MIIKRTGGLGNKRMNEDQPNYYIIEKGQKSGKSPRNLWRPAVAQTSVKDPQIMFM